MPRPAKQLEQGVRQAVACNTSKIFAIVNSERAVRGAAKAHRLFQHRVEYRREVAGRAVDDLQTSAVAVCCSKASRVSVKSRAFSIAITAWSAKVRTNSI